VRQKLAHRERERERERDKDTDIEREREGFCTSVSSEKICGFFWIWFPRVKVKKLAFEVVLQLR
jgi:hypothetical protein